MRYGPSITKIVYEHGVFFIGSPDALEAAQVCRRDELPGNPGRNGTSITQHFGHDRKMRMRRLSAKRFDIYLSAAEIRHRWPGFDTFMAAVLLPVNVD